MGSNITETICKAVENLHDHEYTEKPTLVAIDGRCASGKTTLAEDLKGKIGCNVIHMDDFFLRPEQRTSQRYREAGGNVDYERFLEEVMKPLMAHQEFSYRPYDCKRQRFSEPVLVPPCTVTIIEGAYSCHPAFWEYYFLRIFLTVRKEEQYRRILQRNGKDSLHDFQTKWIPLEEEYFQQYFLESRCDLQFQT